MEIAYCGAAVGEEAPAVLELDWTSDMALHPVGPGSATYDMIIGSDVAYDEDAFQPLLSCILAFVSQSPTTRVSTAGLATPRAHDTSQPPADADASCAAAF